MYLACMTHLSNIKINGREFLLCKDDYFLYDTDDKMYYYPSEFTNISKISTNRLINDRIKISRKLQNTILEKYQGIDNLTKLDTKYIVGFVEEVVVNDEKYTVDSDEEIYHLMLSEKELIVESSKIIKETNKTFFLLNKLGNKTVIKKTEFLNPVKKDKFSFEYIAYSDLQNFDETRDLLFNRVETKLTESKDKLPRCYDSFIELKEKSGY